MCLNFILFRIYLSFHLMPVFVCVGEGYVHMSAGARGGQKVSDSLELDS